MARKHIWFYLKDEDGNPIEGASINLYLKDTTTEATVYESRTASAAFAQSNILSDEDGYFEFYIGDQFEDLPSVGYNANQIFELHWASTEGTGFIDNFQIFDKIYIVDETNSSSTAKDKMISNEQAYKWDQHVLKVYTVLPHGIEPVDETDNSDGTYNKVVDDYTLYRLYNEPLASGGFTLEASGAFSTTHYLYPSANTPSGYYVARDFDPELNRSSKYPITQIYDLTTGDQITPVEIRWMDNDLVRVILSVSAGTVIASSVGELQV